MNDSNNLVEEDYAFFLKHIWDLNVVVDFDSAEDDVSTVTGDHDFKLTITLGDRVADDHGTKLAKAHLEEFSNPVDCFLKFNRLYLVFSFELQFLQREDRLLRSLKRVISQLLDDADHLGDWLDDNLLGVCRKHQGTEGHYDASKDSGHKGILSILNLLLSDVESSIGCQQLAVLDGFISALFGLVADQFHLLDSECTVVIWAWNDLSRTVFIHFPHVFRRIEAIRDALDLLNNPVVFIIRYIKPKKSFPPTICFVWQILGVDILPQLFIVPFFRYPIVVDTETLHIVVLLAALARGKPEKLTESGPLGIVVTLVAQERQDH